ncbi:MAG TPA: AAA family ATPase, partial [Desulfobacteraceae bacterium]|nr:AAA family ATPase [Desulfobacteraceae bacterium]
LPIQAKLLRVLQEQQFERLGSTRTMTVDARIIAATNVRLEDAVIAGSFRNDLYYRLNVVPIVMPHLRERREDIPLLLDHFLRISNKRNEKNLRMSKKFLDFLTEFDWPGNVRELQNLMERLVILSTDDVLHIEDLPEYFIRPVERKPDIQSPLQTVTGTETIRERKSLQDLEREQVEAALVRHGWVQARAARELGLTQRQIGYRMKKFRLKRPQFP